MYLVPSLITLKSLKVKSNEVFELTLINLNSVLNSHHTDLVLKWCELNKIEVAVIPVVVDAAPFKVDARIPLASYGRIYAINLIKQPFIYLDSDLLASNDWDSIFLELDLLLKNNQTILASRERNFSGKNSRNLARRLAGENYFSAAVIGVNPKRIDYARFMQNVYLILENYESNHLWAHDQDVLNQLFYNQLTRLKSVYNSNVWNSQTSKPRILHFDGFFKPWKLSTSGFIITLFLVAGCDLVDMFKTKSHFFRVRGFLQHRKMEHEVKRELQQIQKDLETSGTESTFTANFKKISSAHVVSHLLTRARGSNAAATF